VQTGTGTGRSNLRGALTIEGLRTRAAAVTPGGWIRVGLLVAFLAFYVWTAASSLPISFHSGSDGALGRLADALLHGRASIADASKGLVALDNPYDPVANAVYRAGQDSPFGLHDLSLYQGRMYVYWGPTPAVVLFAPAQLLGFSFSQTLASALFGFAALLFSVLLLLALVRRYAPATPGWMVNGGVILLGLANVIPYTIRRAIVYEVSITSGLCFAMLGVLLIVTGVLRERPSAARLAGGSLSLGLAVGARPTHVITAAVMIVFALWAGRTVKREARARLLVALLAPIGICAVLLMAYNVVRFGSPAEFGLSYQLAGTDVTQRASPSLSYLLPGLWYFLVAPVRVLLTFPFVQLPPPPKYPFHVPATYDGVEPTAGLLYLTPLVLLLLFVPWLRRRRSLEPAAVRIIGALTLIGLLLVVAAAITFWGTTMRYEVDFTTFLLIPALLVWFAMAGVARRRRRLVTIGGTVLVVWGSVLGLALSFTGWGQPLRSAHPALWSDLTRLTSPVSRVMATAGGGARISFVDAPRGVGGAGALPDYLTLGQEDTDFFLDVRPVVLQIVAPTARRIRLGANVIRGPGAPAGTPLQIVVRPKGGAPVVAPVRGTTATGERIALSLRLHGGVNDLILYPRLQGRSTRPELALVQHLAVTKR
jgi:hypothetical protein